MDDRIIVRTFGGFEMSYRGRTITDQDNRSKKLWMLLEYIAAYHDRSISQSTIIDQLWNEESITTDPENALKTSLHRVRNLLDELEIPDKKIIVRKQGTLSWNSALPCDFDFEIFSELHNRVTLTDMAEDERMDCYLKAMELYRGEFLPKSQSESWAYNMATRYHTMYVRLVHDCIRLLLQREEYARAVEYSTAAAAMDPDDEEINYYLILSLYKNGDRQEAVEHYNQVTARYYDEFGIEPPKRFAELYNEITTHDVAYEANLNSIQKDLFEQEAVKEAYLCDYSVFRHLYKIQSRACARNGMSIFMCLITVKQHIGTDTEKENEMIAAGMERLQTVIATSLRSSDIFARYSRNQYIIMLPEACYENSLMIGERILRNFDKSRPRLSLNVSYAVRHLEPQLFGQTAADTDSDAE